MHQSSSSSISQGKDILLLAFLTLISILSESLRLSSTFWQKFTHSRLKVAAPALENLARFRNEQGVYYLSEEVRWVMKTNHLSEEKILQKYKKLPESRKIQVLDFIDFLARKKPPQPSEGDAYAAALEALRLKIRARGGLIKGKTKHQVIKRLRATRETIWKEGLCDHFGQQ